MNRNPSLLDDEEGRKERRKWTKKKGEGTRVCPPVSKSLENIYVCKKRGHDNLSLHLLSASSTHLLVVLFILLLLFVVCSWCCCHAFPTTQRCKFNRTPVNGALCDWSEVRKKR
eukprot:TRINITY_DN1727_c0_g1_i3.p1 TRINITY_DN1727_c0_g1~~TRINITY_DN1727_c0_g1_i3.p1  ORF type:complete len:114 (-),score=11.29 TRINITY_DN1727_c0_g1_i3:113-454(-)